MRRLKLRREFLRAARGRKCAVEGLVLQALHRGDEDGPRIGFTVSRRVGNAPQRNRARRRLKEAARAVMEDLAKPGFDYVVIGRQRTLTRPFEALKEDFTTALAAVHGEGRSKRTQESGR